MDGRIIESDLTFDRIDQREFQSIDFIVMGAAFDIQNDMGRLFSETIYRNELKERLACEFDNVECEVPIKVVFDGFQKTYKADLVINGKAIFELKAIERTVVQHRLQLQQYLFLTNLKHGKLINFSSPKVTGEYVSTSLDILERKRMSFQTDRFLETDTAATRFKDLIMRLLKSFGGFLNLELYYQATEFHLGGIHSVVQPIPIVSSERVIGSQKAHMLSDSSAYKITAMSKDVDAYRAELRRFIQHTKLETIQWVNLNKHEISFETISKP